MSRIQAQHDAQIVRAALPLLTLSLLAERESYGYELVERLASLALDVTTGLVYPVLARLERDGHVTTYSVASSSGPPRKYFSLTPAGMEARAVAHAQWQSVSAAVSSSVSTGSVSAAPSLALDQNRERR